MSSNTTFDGPLPFQRFASFGETALSTLAWDECFAFTKEDILTRFVVPLQDAPNRRGGYTGSLRSRADILAYMLDSKQNPTSAIAITTGIHHALSLLYEKSKGQRTVPEVTRLSDRNPQVPSHESLALIQWRAPNRDRGQLECYTVFDILASLMSEAATVNKLHRFPSSFFERLLALFAHWCTRIRPNENFRPATVCIINVVDTIVLGATIPDIPSVPRGKEYIRQTRQVILAGKKKWEEMAFHKSLNCQECVSMQGGQRYGNCAETSLFSLLCLVDKHERVQARGLAMSTPDGGFVSEAEEHLRQMRMCPNCHRMTKLCIETDAGRDGVTVRYMDDRSAWWSSKMP